jgi:trimethylamine--corrinoid protein Co-methyltransferase
LITQLPWKQLRYRHPPFELLSSDAIESIHRAGLSILQETGMLILSQQARQHYASAGFDLSPDSDLVRFDSELVESLVAKAPARFTLQARNPAKNLTLGDGYAVFTSVGGPAYVMDSASKPWICPRLAGTSTCFTPSAPCSTRTGYPGPWVAPKPSMQSIWPPSA